LFFPLAASAPLLFFCDEVLSSPPKKDGMMLATDRDGTSGRNADTSLNPAA
jgi:hypothetical protein